MKNTVRQASIKTTTPCRLVWIDRNTFKRLLGPLEGILSRNMDKYRKMMDHWLIVYQKLLYFYIFFIKNYLILMK